MYDTVDFSTSFNVRMMLNKETGETWDDFYTNENSYKIYDDPDTIEIPVTDIIAGASDHILNNAEIAEAIEGWILKKINILRAGLLPPFYFAYIYSVYISWLYKQLIYIVIYVSYISCLYKQLIAIMYKF